MSYIAILMSFQTILYINYDVRSKINETFAGPCRLGGVGGV